MTPTKVLLVHDDDSQWIKSLAESPAKSRMTLLHADGESEALALLERHLNIDVMILDAEIGSMNCITFLRTVKNAYPLLQIVLLAGHGCIGTAIEGMKQGAFDYIVKPCTAERISTTIHEAKAIKAGQEAKIAEALAMQIAMHRGD